MFVKNHVCEYSTRPDPVGWRIPMAVILHALTQVGKRSSLYRVVILTQAHVSPHHLVIGSDVLPAMFRHLLACLDARREQRRLAQHAEYVRSVEAARYARHPDSLGYQWGMRVWCRGLPLPRRRVPVPRRPVRRQRRRRSSEPDPEPDPDSEGDVIYL